MTRPDPSLHIEQQNESVVLRMLAWGEARNQSAIGIAAVLWVVRNRALKHDTSLKYEALRPLQFSCFNEGDPNRYKMLNACDEDPLGWAKVDDVCTLFEAGHLHDPTLGSLNYYVTKMPTPPAWASAESGWLTRAVIGAHSFGVAA